MLAIIRRFAKGANLTKLRIMVLIISFLVAGAISHKVQQSRNSSDKGHSQCERRNRQASVPRGDGRIG